MEDKLYRLMNWPRIEGILYSEEDNPHQILGVHRIGRNLLFQAFFPDTISARLLIMDDKEEKTFISYKMELADESGFYAYLLNDREWMDDADSKKAIPEYEFEYVSEDGIAHRIVDPYQFEPTITKKEIERFQAGTNYTIYKVLGAHHEIRNGISGTHFAVWAPNAIRVSTVGDFNQFDGRWHQMSRIGDSGIFELFIPEVHIGDNYQYELKIKGGLTYVKSDPYALEKKIMKDGSTVSVVSDFELQDEEGKREKSFSKKEIPINIFEVFLGSYAKKIQEELKMDSLPGYEILAESLVKYVKELGYTHIELLPIMEYIEDSFLGYQTTGYYAPTSRFGKPEEFRKFVDIIHKGGIEIILDWVPSNFPREDTGLSYFDGSSLYEFPSEDKAIHPLWSSMVFNYERKEVQNFLIANALFWLEQYHIDGLKMDGLGSMLYLDYYRKEGEWKPNIYGGNENLEAISFLKDLNKIVKKRKTEAIMIAESDCIWPGITSTEENGLGFDFCFQSDWSENIINSSHMMNENKMEALNKLTLNMMYTYEENFILPIRIGKGSIEKDYMKLLYSYHITHPGKKLWYSSDKDMLDNDVMKSFIKTLHDLYTAHPALYEMDYKEKGFLWVDHVGAKKARLSYVRKSDEEVLFIILNFEEESSIEEIGVPFEGCYKEIFNSDHLDFAGNGFCNAKIKKSIKKETDGQKNAIKIKLPKYACCIFKFLK